MIQHEKAKKNPFYVVDQSIEIAGKDVILALSGGKESLCCLDLIHDRFESIFCYHMYLVKGLSFRENQFESLRRRYPKIREIIQVPHPSLYGLIKAEVSRFESTVSDKIRRMTYLDVDNFARVKSGCEWIFGGEKIIDSITRQAMIKPHGGIDFLRRRVMPVAWWNDQQVYQYIKSRKIQLPADYGIVFSLRRKGRRQNGLHGIERWAFKEIKRRNPEDARKILEVFPLIEEAAMQLELNEGRDHVELTTLKKKKPIHEGEQLELSEEDAEQASNS